MTHFQFKCKMLDVMKNSHMQSMTTIATMKKCIIRRFCTLLYSIAPKNGPEVEIGSVEGGGGWIKVRKGVGEAWKLEIKGESFWAVSSFLSRTQWNGLEGGKCYSRLGSIHHRHGENRFSVIAKLDESLVG